MIERLVKVTDLARGDQFKTADIGFVYVVEFIVYSGALATLVVSSADRASLRELACVTELRHWASDTFVTRLDGANHE